MFKRKAIVAALTGLLLIASSIANAGVFDTTRYSLGGELSLLNSAQYTGASTHDVNMFKSSPSDSTLVIRKNKPGFNIFVAARFSEYVGAELGYGYIFKVSGNGTGGNLATNKITNTYVDLLGYMPVAARVDLIGELGAGGLKSHADVANVTFYNLDSLNKVKFGYRVGGGVQFYMTNNWVTRMMLRYQTGNKSFLVSLTSFSVGVIYVF